MTLVTKSIRGQKYYYLQDAVKVDNKNKIITTFISRVDAEGEDLLNAKKLASAKHFLKILKEASVIKKRTYKFENFSSDDQEVQLANDMFEFIKILYESSIKVLSEQDSDGFQKALFTRYVYGTTAIEGNTLTEDETFRLLAADLTPKNKSINEALSVANYNNVKEYMDGYSGPITENLIKRIHKLLMTGIRGQNGKLINAGEYRQGQATLAGIGFKLPEAELVPTQIRYFNKEYETKIQNNVHPIEIATYYHQKFEQIHPFEDGNGRVGREILNYMLTKEGFPPIYITPKQRSEYLTALQEGNTENFKDLFLFILSRIEATLNYLYSKTSLYDIVVKEETIEDAKKLGMEEVVKSVLEKMKKYHDTDELP